MSIQFEADEDYEADEAVDLSAALTKARTLANRLGAAARRAQDAQKSLRRRFGATRRAAPIREQDTGSLTGGLEVLGVVTAELPDGRRINMRMSPTLASLQDVDAVSARVTANDRRNAAAEAAIDQLASTQADTAKQLTEALVASNAALVASNAMLSRRITALEERLDKRITKELKDCCSGKSEQQHRALRKQLANERTRRVWSAITGATSSPFFTAYGDRSSPFATDNIILTASQTAWTLLGEVVDGGLLSYLPFVGNGLTNYVLFHGGQYEQFVSGVTTVTVGLAGTSVTVPIASNYQATFNSLAPNISVSTTLVSSNAGPFTVISGVASATVNNQGVLTIVLAANYFNDVGSMSGTAQVAWVVDTQAQLHSQVT